jgi:hypothetical protein
MSSSRNDTEKNRYRENLTLGHNGQRQGADPWRSTLSSYITTMVAFYEDDVLTVSFKDLCILYMTGDYVYSVILQSAVTFLSSSGHTLADFVK